MKQMVLVAFSKCGWYEVRVNSRTNHTYIVGLHSRRNYRYNTKTGTNTEIDKWASNRNVEWVYR